jgi:hypothetical protein
MSERLDSPVVEIDVMSELDAESIDMVAGGINPQPLPPEHMERRD